MGAWSHLRSFLLVFSLLRVCFFSPRISFVRCDYSCVSLVSLVTVFHFFCSGYAWVQSCSGDLVVRTWPMPFGLFLCQFNSVLFCVATMVKWTRRWKPIWIPHGNSFQKAFVEEWEQEIHTSDDPIQECGYRWKDPSTWSRRAHESSEKEMFASLTGTDSGDESDSPCESYCAPKLLDFDYVPYGAHKPADNGWHTPCASPPAPPGFTIHAAVFLAALLEYRFP